MPFIITTPIAGATYSVTIKYDWNDFPSEDRDYTVGVYTKETVSITDDSDQTSVLYADGVNTPSELTGNSYSVSSMVAIGNLPAGIVMHDEDYMPNPTAYSIAEVWQISAGFFDFLWRLIVWLFT